MIIREWRGRALANRPTAYPDHFHDNVLPELRETEGFMGASLSRRDLGERIEFVVLTKWSSYKSIESFSGADISKAVVEQGAIAALVDYDVDVRHYEVISEI